MRTTSKRVNATYNRIINSNPTPKFKPVALDPSKLQVVAKQAASGIARNIEEAFDEMIESEEIKAVRVEMDKAFEQIEAERAERVSATEYVEYVKQFSPEVVKNLLGSEEVEEKEVEVEEVELETIEEDTLVSKEFNTDESLEHHESFVKLFAPKVVDIPIAIGHGHKISDLT